MFCVYLLITRNLGNPLCYTLIYNFNYMDKRIVKPWYMGVTHVLTSYVGAGIFTFVLVFIIVAFALLFRVYSETARVYISFLSSLVFIPILLFPATMYSIKFIMGRYVVSEKENVVRFSLVSIAILKIIIEWLSFTSFSIAGTLSFLLSLVVFYGVSVKYLEINEGKDSFNLKDIKMNSTE